MDYTSAILFCFRFSGSRLHLDILYDNSPMSLTFLWTLKQTTDVRNISLHNQNILAGPVHEQLTVHRGNVLDLDII